MPSFCSPEDGQAQVRIMYANGDSDLIVLSENLPIEISEEGYFDRPAWAIYAYYYSYDEYNPENNIDQYFANFFELPSGWDRNRFYQAFELGELQAVYSDFKMRFFAFGQSVFSVNGFLHTNQYRFGVDCFINDKNSYDRLSTHRLGNLPLLPQDQISGNFSPANNGTFTLFIYDINEDVIYESDPAKGNYLYDVSCGDCDNLTQLKIRDDSSTGYRCLPYENLINWAKIQRQKLNQI